MSGFRIQAPDDNRWRESATALLLICILALAAFVRVVGLGWGLPNEQHWFSYHPDEVMVISAADRVNLARGEWNPHFFNYGSALIYAVSFARDVLSAYAPTRQGVNQMADLTLAGRGIVALCGVLTVYVVFLIGRRLKGNRVGLLAAALMAVIPMHVLHSHYLTVDVPATLLITLSLYSALRYGEVGLRAAVWAGVYAGLAAGTKYNAGLVLLAGWTAVWLAREIGVPDRKRHALWMTLACIAAFVVSTPGAVLATGEFLRDFRYEALHVSTGHGLVFANTGPGWWYHLKVNLWQGVGTFTTVAVAIAVLLGIRRWKLTSGFWTLIAFALPYFVLISLAEVRFQRYTVPLLPVLCVAAAIALVNCSHRAWIRWPLYLVALSGTTLQALLLVYFLSQLWGEIEPNPDSRYFVGDVREAVANTPELETGTVGLTRSPWFFSPPLSPANGGPQSERIFRERQMNEDSRIVTLAPEADSFPEWPEFVVLSDYEVADALRLSDGQFPGFEEPPQKVVNPDKAPYPEARRLARLWNNVLDRYEVVGIWRPDGAADWSSLPPHDAYYPWPTLIVFERKG